ncbi:MAG TPA: hypothetical protein VMZ30_11270 [Pyrinomonadaceae bacterium]|nr:hypothetical protein [Pyrinomonadaceae bacterium]
MEIFLINEGRNETIIEGASDADLILLTTGHYRRTLPHPDKASHCDLSAALKAVRESRNKVHAHNEAIDAAARTRPTWGGTENLVAYAKDFVCVIAMAFLARWMGKGGDDYYLSYDAARTGHFVRTTIEGSKANRLKERMTG